MPCPHYDIKIVQRSSGQSAVAAAAYQSGEKLFSEYDQQQKYYSHKSEIVHKEIMLPPHAPPEYADRGILWNSAEAVEKQWNSQLARRVILAIPRELPPEQYTGLIRDYCREFFVSKGMVADFAIHDKGDGNPHAHILLTMRAMDEKGKWLPKSRKIYDLDENGEKIRLPSGRWKSHKENTVDWNDQKYAEIWRQGWSDTVNRCLEAVGCPERLDLRSYARQGIEQVPTVHMGAAVAYMEKKGIQTNIGNLNRDIKEANRIMQSIRQMVRHLKDWISDLRKKKAAIMEALEQAKEPTLPGLLYQYLLFRQEERIGWTAKGQLKGSVSDFNRVEAAIDFLKTKEIATVESLDRHLDGISEKAVSIQGGMKKAEKRVRAIDTMLAYIDKYEKYKPVHAEYVAIGWKKKKEKFAESHWEELDAYNTAVRYFKANLKGNSYSRKDLESERQQLAAALPGQRKELETVQADVKVLRDVRHWLNQVLPPEQYRQTAEPGKKPSVQESLKGQQERIRQEQAERQKPPRTQEQQNMEL
ncbi:MAG: MobA/MobL family protein [Butyrivibrio sp.]|nr:MobA/MobL family protein [Butyrivibrio sp.]